MGMRLLTVSSEHTQTHTEEMANRAHSEMPVTGRSVSARKNKHNIAYTRSRAHTHTHMHARAS